MPVKQWQWTVFAGDTRSRYSHLTEPQGLDEFSGAYVVFFGEELFKKHAAYPS